jgi:Domain of unknown function (DUF1918)
MVEVGDEIELSTKKVGQAPRTGTVIAVRERLVTVRWPTGEQSTLVPSPGTLSVVRPAKGKNAESKPSTKSAESENASTRKQTTATKAPKKKRASGGASNKKSSGTKRSR